MNNYIFQSATELAGLIRCGEATSSEIVKAHIAHIKKHNPNLNAIVILLEKEALETAEICDREAKEGKFRGPLHGVPMTIKEQYWLKGTKSTLNSNRLKDWEAPEDAVVVERLKKAGAIILGKTNVAKELLDYQISGDIYPEGKNPYNLACSPGGSSGGAAAALASGMIPIELGGDFGGSIRIPSNFCGVYGLKPTENTIPGHGHAPKPQDSRGFVFHMAVGGPMARNPEDLELLWKILKGPHKSDRLVSPVNWFDPSVRKLSDYKVSWVDNWPGYDTSGQTKLTIRNFVRQLSENGCLTESKKPQNDLHNRSLSVHKRLSLQLITQEVPWFIKPLMIASLKNGFLKGIKNIPWKLKDSFLGYSEVMGQRAEIIKEWEAYFEEFDFLVCPIGFGPAYPRCKTGTPITYEGKKVTYLNYVWPYNACFNASGHPAIHIPLGIGKEGLPIGVQVVGAYWREPDLLHFAKLISVFTKGFVKPTGFE